MKRALPKSGFTIVELALVTSIVAVIGMVVYGTFANGMSIWRKVTEETQAEDINLLLDKIAFDLRNSFQLTGLRFKGEGRRVSFPAQMKYQDQGELKNTIGRVSYYVDRRKKTLVRNEANYSEVFRRKQGTDRVLSENISSLKFRYFIYDEQRKVYMWVDQWQDQEEAFGLKTEERLPLIVQVEVGIPGDKKEQTFVRTVKIPSGCCWPLEEEAL